MARVALLLLAAMAARAQSVEIAFTNSVTHAPLPGLSTLLKGPDSFAASTGADGVVRFAKVPPGDYTILYQADGFVVSEAVTRPFHAGDAPVRLAFELTPWARVSGRVLDPDGKPVPAALVVLSSLRADGGSHIDADSDGRFTIATPFPGRYTLFAAAPRDNGKWAPTFYPAALSAADAQAISLRPGVELSGCEIRLRSVAAHRLAGIVRDDAGNPASGTAVTLVDERRIGAERKTNTGDDGSFAFDAVHEGDWSISASLSRGDVELLAEQPLTVGRRDPDRVRLRLERPFSLRATVEWDGPPSRTPVAPIILLYPEPRHPTRAGARRQPDGSLVFPAVYPGRYDIQVIASRPGFYLDSVKLGDRDALGHSVELVEGVPPLRVVYKSGAGAIRARVDGGSGAVVVAVPQEEALRSTLLLRDTKADPEGRAELRDLRPGDYYVFAFDVYEIDALRDPAFVTRLIARAEKVHVDENATAGVDLKVTPWPE